MTKETNINHADRAHAVLSASGASRWIACTPSAMLEEATKERRDSGYANEGTLAHELAEACIRLKFGMITEQEYAKEFFRIRSDKYYTSEMLSQSGKYVDYVCEEYNVIKKQDPSAVLLIEESVSLEEYTTEKGGKGTCDTIIVADTLMKVIDLKYGKGIAVSAQDNPQLKVYGLGALDKYGFAFGVENIELVIVQPRLDSLSTFEISADQLEDWGKLVLKPAAKKALKGSGEQIPGDHCQFCRVRPRCSALRLEALRSAQTDFAEPLDTKKIKETVHLLGDDQLIEIYSKASLITSWIKAVSDYVETEARAGKKWEGFKLVSGKGRRVISDEAKARELLDLAFYEKSQYLNTKLKGFGELEKLTGKSNFYKILGPVVVQTLGGPSLVPESDRRPELISSAKQDFKVDDEDF